MSITEGMTGGGSWSGRRTLPPFPHGAGFRSLGRPQVTLLDVAVLGSLAALPFLAGAGSRGLAAARVAAPGLSRVGKSVWAGLGFVKRPIHTTLAWRVPYSPGPSHLITRSLGWRKKGNMALLGLAAVNPLENVNYIRKRDWTRLFINYHLPFIGVPIYNLHSSGGDGPGEIPNFHQPPPSIEEIGKLTSEPYVVVEIPESSRPSTSGKVGKRRKCPPGYRPVGDKCVRIWGTKHPLYLG